MVRLSAFFKDGVRFDCLSPGGCDGHCCSGAGQIYIFNEDIERLMKHFSVDLETFIDTYCKVEETASKSHPAKWLPIIMIKEQEEIEGKPCIFLENGLCAVHVARPFQCRGFPFWFMNTKTKSAWEKLAETCPGIPASRDNPDAQVYSGKDVKDLVQQEQDMDDAWDAAMLKWKGDYRGYLKSWLAGRE
jgi:hypothetical protein